MPKLFQIEEPDGGPVDASVPGVAVGMALGRAEGAVAIAVGGNAEILPGNDGATLLIETDITALLKGLRAWAEKQLARPVTHAVIAIRPIEEGPLAAAAEAAGLVVLEQIDIGTKPIERAASEAAVLAEDLAPRRN
jgi:hypothetical protein